MRKAEAERDLEDYVAGAQHLTGGMDYIKSFVARTQGDILEFEAFIAALPGAQWLISSDWRKVVQHCEIAPFVS